MSRPGLYVMVFSIWCNTCDLEERLVKLDRYFAEPPAVCEVPQ